jgi:hypothetical protein
MWYGTVPWYEKRPYLLSCLGFPPCFLAWLMAAMEAPTGECCGKPRMRVCG